MTASRPQSAASQLAEQHLGDRLSALVDGELGHDARERVLAHVATCPKCKVEVDAQRRLKNVFAEVAPPPPSESFLARLQGLPGGDDRDGDGGAPPFGGGGFLGRVADTGVPGVSGLFGMSRGEPFSFGYVPARPNSAASALAPSDPDRGFRIHDVSRHDADRAASRGLRFAFVAAGAVSLAAVALGGVTTGMPAGSSADPRGGPGSGSNVTPAGTQGTGAAAAPDTQRRRQTGPLLAQGQSGRPLVGGGTVAAPTSVSAPLLPGGSSPATGQTLRTLTTPVTAGAAVMSPLIRPLTETAPVSLTKWPTAPEVMTPGILAAPVPDTTSAPSTPAR